MIGQFLAGLAILALMVLGTFAYGFMLADWDGGGVRAERPL